MIYNTHTHTHIYIYITNTTSFASTNQTTAVPAPTIEINPGTNGPNSSEKSIG